MGLESHSGSYKLKSAHLFTSTSHVSTCTPQDNCRRQGKSPQKIHCMFANIHCMFRLFSASPTNLSPYKRSPFSSRHHTAPSDIGCVVALWVGSRNALAAAEPATGAGADAGAGADPDPCPSATGRSPWRSDVRRSSSPARCVLRLRLAPPLTPLLP